MENRSLIRKSLGFWWFRLEIEVQSSGGAQIHLILSPSLAGLDENGADLAEVKYRPCDKIEKVEGSRGVLRRPRGL